MNSKHLDTLIKLPKVFFDKEIEVKKIVAERLDRGKVAINISYERKDSNVAKITFNEKLFKSYYKEINRIANDAGAPSEGLFKMAMEFPEVMRTEETKDKLQDDWNKVKGHYIGSNYQM